MRDMLDAHVDSLLDVPVADLLVDDDAHGAFADVIDNARLAVVHFVWHAELEVRKRPCIFVSRTKVCDESIQALLPLLNSSIGLDVHDVANPVAHENRHSIATPAIYLYCRRYVPRGIMPRFLKDLAKAYCSPS